MNEVFVHVNALQMDEATRIKVLLFGLLLDLAGAIVIAVAVFSYSHRHLQKLQEEQQELEKILLDTKHYTIWGMVLIIAGFVLIFSAEAYALWLLPPSL